MTLSIYIGKMEMDTNLLCLWRRPRESKVERYEKIYEEGKWVMKLYYHNCSRKSVFFGKSEGGKKRN